jgi:hypothetical protein
MKKGLFCVALLGVCAMTAQAAFVTPGFGLLVDQGEEADWAQPISNSDLIAAAIGTELAGDTGWHPANPANGDSLNANGLPAFTDGVAEIGSGVTGLLNDFPGQGAPTKRVQYDFGSATDIGQINVYTGNNGRDGRIFHTYTVEFSTDNGANWSTPIYVQSHDSGTINNAGQNQWRTVLSRLYKPGDRLVDDATNVRFDFYAVDNGGGQMRDAYDGINPFTGFDDGLTFAFVSPLLWEIDIKVPEPGSMALLAMGSLALLRRRR